MSNVHGTMDHVLSVVYT